MDEIAKFPVDAFGQKAYRPARNSTNPISTADNLKPTDSSQTSKPTVSRTLVAGSFYAKRLNGATT
jgi:hypothetical protein